MIQEINGFKVDTSIGFFKTPNIKLGRYLNEGKLSLNQIGLFNYLCCSAANKNMQCDNSYTQIEKKLKLSNSFITESVFLLQDLNLLTITKRNNRNLYTINKNLFDEDSIEFEHYSCISRNIINIDLSCKLLGLMCLIYDAFIAPILFKNFNVREKPTEEIDSEAYLNVLPILLKNKARLLNALKIDKRTLNNLLNEALEKQVLRNALVLSKKTELQSDKVFKLHSNNVPSIITTKDIVGGMIYLDEIAKETARKIESLENKNMLLEKQLAALGADMIEIKKLLKKQNILEK